MNINISFSDGNFYFSVNEKIIVYKNEKYLTLPACDFLHYVVRSKNGILNEKDFEKFLKTNPEEGMTHLSGVLEVAKSGGEFVYSLYYDRPSERTNQEILGYIGKCNNQKNLDSLSREDMKKIFQSGKLYSPAKDLKIIRNDGRVRGFSYLPSWEEVEKKIFR